MKSFLLFLAKSYRTTDEENERRNQYFENERTVAAHNQLYDLGFYDFRLGTNKYSDLVSTSFLIIQIQKGNYNRWQGHLIQAFIKYVLF